MRGVQYQLLQVPELPGTQEVLLQRGEAAAAAGRGAGGGGRDKAFSQTGQFTTVGGIGAAKLALSYNPRSK